MAIVLVGVTSGGLAGTTNANYTISLSGTLTGGLASSPSQNDIVVVLASHTDTASNAPTVSGNTSGAYTGAVAASYSNSTRDINARMFYKVQGGTPDTTLTITRTASASFGAAAIVQVWRGVDTTTPLDVAGAAATGVTANSDPPSIAPTTAGSMIVYGAAAAVSAANTNAATDQNSDSNFVTTQFAGSSSRDTIYMESHTWTSGAYDPAPMAGVSSSSGDAWAAQIIALREGSAPAATNSNNFFKLF